MHSKLPGVGPTIFSVMTQLANEHGAINLSQGFPDFSVSPRLISLVESYMRKGNNQYAPMQGVHELRAAISKKVEKTHAVALDPSTEIAITAGGTQAIYTAITALVQPGQEVVVFTPAYDCYAPAVLLSQAIPIFVPLKPPNFGIDWQKFEQAIGEKTRMVIINSPHNPTGSILSLEDMKRLEQLALEKDLLVLSDEVYEHIIFEGKKHHSVLDFPGLADRSFAVASFGKLFHATGWKIGYCIAKGALMEEFLKVHQFNVFSCNTPLQYAIAEFMEREEEYNQLGSFFASKRDDFLQAIAASRFEYVPSQGTYFQLLDYSKISTEKDVAFAKRLTKELGVASIPISVFSEEETNTRFLRFCFAKKSETLKRAGELLCKI